MEEELRLSLLLLGGFFILAVLAHGLWSIRKNNQSKKLSQRVDPQEWQNEEIDTDEDDAEAMSQHAQQFDEFGIGEIRVVNSNDDVEQQDSVEIGLNSQPDCSEEENDDAEDSGPIESDGEPAEKLYASVVTNPKPQFNQDKPNDILQSVPAPPSFLLKSESKESPATDAATDDDFSLDAQSQAKQEIKKTEPEKREAKSDTKPIAPPPKRRKRTTKRRQEPKIGGEDQMQIDFDSADKKEPVTTVSNAEVQQEVLILNVRAPESEPISGAALLPMLLTLGFKFGEQDVFHRHVNANGKGAVLFSLANMFKPGNFDIDNLETFTTGGVSLFMILPIESDPHQVFNMMHNAARKIADEFDGQVLDGRRSVLTKQGLQQYVEKIRDFERKRMIAR